MQTAMYLYVLRFVLCFWFAPDHTHRAEEIRAIAHDIASTDCSVKECLELAEIASMESGFERAAVGKLGEVGAFQNLHGDPSAKAALRLLRLQGLLHYMGCTTETETCMRMAANRSVKAIIYSATFPFVNELARVASR
jgi:hypothetical protein